MELSVDKRIELMAVIQTLDHYWDNLSMKYSDKKLFKCKYKKNVDNYFKKYKKHETVKLLSKLCNTVHDISTFINFILCYTIPPKFDSIANIENNANCLIKENIPHENIIDGVRHFYEDTNFEYFFENNRNEYEKLINDYINKNDLENYVNIVDIYLGNHTKNYTVAISALLMGNFGIKILTRENITENYSVISPLDYKEKKYIFGPEYSILDNLWHEISHLTINDLTKSYISLFNINNKEVSEVFIKQFYTSIEAIVNEYIIRAITIRLFEINFGEKTAENLIQYEIQKGFKEIVSIKNYISKNCERCQKFTKEEEYKKLLKYVINKI
jgi:hypothetical protein